MPISMTWFIIVFSGLMGSASGEDFMTNSVQVKNSPKWLKRVRVERIAERIERNLEWSIRRVTVQFYNSPEEYARSHNLGPTAMAVTKRADSSVHLGPKVTESNFDEVFAHELVHVISFQKYKEAIPGWLEEGLASYWSRKGRIDYKWLASRPFPEDVRKMLHPYSGTYDNTLYHYRASQALAEMIAKKCDLSNLLRLSVQKKMESYIATYCEIKDLNKSFQAWVQSGGKVSKRSQI